MDESGACVEMEIGSLAAGGDGVGRLADGRAVFVPFTAPGDRVRVRLESLHPRYARGELLEVLSPGPDRSEPRCPVFGDCGGCQWQHLDYAAQAAAKRQIVADALLRIGHLELPGPVEWVPSPAPYATRSRARVAVRKGQVGFRRRKSHEICAVSRCPVLEKDVDVRLGELASDSSPRDGEWELSAGGARRLGDTGPSQEWRVGSDRLRVSPGVFFQVHGGLHEALLGAVLEAAGSGALAVELYSGAGFFTLGLARSFERVVAVEGDRAAVADLRHNLERAGAAGVEVERQRVEALLRSPRLSGLAPDAVVLDPPRSGLPAGCVEALAALAPDRVVYLSCDPATLARDLARWVAAGYRIEGVGAFDLFPQTPHIEVLARLSRATLERPLPTR